MSVFNPIVFAKGDEATAEVAQKVADTLFEDIPRVDIPCSVEQRLDTGDECLTKFVQDLDKFGAGYKGSTASNDPRIILSGLGSANIKLRGEAGVIGMFRMIQYPAKYQKPVAIFRYGSGGFYNETGCEIVVRDGIEFAVITQEMNLTDLTPYAQIAIDLALHYGMNLYLSSKWTIAKSEALFCERIESVFKEEAIQYQRQLTDIRLARIAKDRKGGWISCFDNPNGDSGSDIAELVDGSRSMGSTLYRREGAPYEELPGGTAPDLLGTNYDGAHENFFNPLAIIMALSNCVTRVNPVLHNWCDQAVQNALQYLKFTPSNQYHTWKMIDFVTENTGSP